MTKKEFLAEFDRMIDAFGEDHWPDVRVELVFQHMHGVDQAWLKKKVDAVILNWDTRFDWVEAAKGHRIVKENQELKRLEETAFQQGPGLENILKSFGANNLLEVLERQKVKQNEPA